MFDNHEELLRNDCHPWCRSTARDEAVRAAEDGRQGPLPTLSEAIASFTNHDAPPGARVSDRQCASSADTGANTAGAGLRKERVTLEVTHNEFFPVSEWSWLTMLRLRSGESVRVVTETNQLEESMNSVCREEGFLVLSEEVAAQNKEIDRLREERRWIPVGERLPDLDVLVLVWQQGYTAIGWREHQPYYIVPETIWTLGDELDKGYPPEKITHWMPLPPGPEANA